MIYTITIYFESFGKMLESTDQSETKMNSKPLKQI